jgi:hypothetical protein
MGARTYRVTIVNSQDEWQYEVNAGSKADALDRAKKLAAADGWNGFTLGSTVEKI